MSQKELLKSAVHNHQLASREGMLERLFTWWFGRFVYNQIWEDPRVDLRALRLGPGSRVVTIASGGCNVLNYLAAEPEAIFAVDLNPAHVALTRLKLAALRHLPDHARFYRFFGEADDRLILSDYQQHLRAHLDGETRRFWETAPAFGRAPINCFARGLYHHSLLGRFIGFLHVFARLFGGRPQLLLTARSLDDQRRVFEESIAPVFDRWITQVACRMPVVFYSLGIPPAQFAALQAAAAGDIVGLYRERVRRLACDFPLADNYFAWQAFGRRYDREHRQALPDYLQEETYARIRPLADRVKTELSSMTTFLARQSERSLDGYVLLDAQDWMSPEQMTELWREIGRTARPGARAIFRTAGAHSPLPAALPSQFQASWTYEETLSRDLFSCDRSAIYGGFHVYTHH
ncbi:MAG: BtaA family protein [Proteobacteria bacterium]|nr:BtaA family protein [Pseudomonadota bacterium]